MDQSSMMVAMAAGVVGALVVRAATKEQPAQQPALPMPVCGCANANCSSAPQQEVSKPKLTRQQSSKDNMDDDGFTGRGGWSMEEAQQHSLACAKLAHQRSPAQVLSDLQKGNARFWTGVATRPEMSAFERRAMIMRQYPSVAILGCSDSRVPIEIVFDQGLGDLFVIRVAGNALDMTTTASLEYAVVHLNVKVLVVMGHEGCGAVKAARLPAAQIAKEPKDLGGLLNAIKEGLDEEHLPSIRDVRARDREAVVSNVHHQLKGLQANTRISEKVSNGDLIVAGAFYEISSGIVDFFNEKSESM